MGFKIEWFMIGFLGMGLFRNGINYKLYTAISLFAFVCQTIIGIVKEFKK